MYAKTVYIAGPIAGIDDFVERFEKIEKMLVEWGFDPINPVNIEPHDHEGECPPAGPIGQGQDGGHTSSACYMRADIEALMKCNYIYLMDGWRNSIGASTEAALARAVGIPELVVVDTRRAPDVIENWRTLWREMDERTKHQVDERTK